ncbi:MAG: heparinase II/III-family protein [Opitutaceae bacterium]|nr:heparinase II/III-family protein [Opitutaceae bacterium]
MVIALPQVRAAVQWPGVNDAEARELAATQAETWRRNIRGQKILLGMGPDGRARFSAHAASDAPALRRLRATAEILAETIVTRPVPVYRSPEEIAATGRRTLYQANGELWMRESGDELVLLSLTGAIEDAHIAPRARAHLRYLVLELCRYPTWGRSPDRNRNNHDLAAGHVARGIAMAWAWHRDVWKPEEQTLIINTIRERVGTLASLIPGGIFWSRAYADNHNHVNAAAVGWCGAAFLEDLPEEAPLWFARALLDFRNVARYYNPDGSSPEGVAYWSYGVSFILQYLEGMRGIVDVSEFYDGDWLRNMATFRLHAATSGFGSTLPWGDAVPRDFYGPHHLLNRFASQYRSSDAACLSGQLPWPPAGGPDVAAWAWLWFDPSVPAVPPSGLDAHIPALDIVNTRSGWSGRDYLLSLKSGYTNRNHSHLDAGSIALAFGDEWLIVTPGYGDRSGEHDFWQSSGPRWEYASNATESHSTLLINRRNQRFDAQARGTTRTFFTSPAILWTEVDLSDAYADVRSVWRRLFHRRGDYFLIFDNLSLPEPALVEWLLQTLPSASIKDNGVRLGVTSRTGAVDVQLLPSAASDEAWDTPVFAPRSLLSPKNNVSAKRLATFSALRRNLGEGGFRVLVRPRRRDAEVSSLDVEQQSRDGKKETWVIRSNDWTDTLTLDLSPQTPVRLLVQRQIRSTTRSTTPSGLTVIAARQIETPILSILPAAEASGGEDAGISLTATRIDDALWELTSDASPETIRTRIRPAPGWRLHQPTPSGWQLHREARPDITPSESQTTLSP